MTHLQLTGWLALGQTIAMVCPAQLQAVTTLDELSGQIAPLHRVDSTLISLQTESCRVLVIGNRSGKIGALLLHSKTRKDKLQPTITKFTELITHSGKPEIIYSPDEYSAIVLYTDICRRESEGRRDIVATDRLSCLFNLRQHNRLVPHRWHDGGVAMRGYSDDRLTCEVCPDLSSPQVEYVEIRLPKSVKSTTIPDLTAHDYGLPGQPRELRKLSAQLNGATPLSVHPDNGTYLVRSKDVYSLGKLARIQTAVRQRRDKDHYIFPDITIRKDIATFRTPEPPAPAQQPVAQPSPQPLTPPEARRSYIETLRKL